MSWLSSVMGIHVPLETMVKTALGNAVSKGTDAAATSVAKDVSKAALPAATRQAGQYLSDNWPVLAVVAVAGFLAARFL